MSAARLVVAIACLAAIAYRPAGAEPTPPPATLTADAPDHDAGAVAAGTSVSHVFTLVNHGPRPLTLTVRPDCGCTTTRFDGVIPAGGTGTVEATVDTTRVHGRVTKSVRVNTDDATLPTLVLSLSVEALRALKVSPSEEPILRGPTGAVAAAELTVSAPKGGRFEIVGVEDDAMLRATFAVVPDAERSPGGTSSDGPFRYRVTLTPAATLAPGTYRPKVTLITTRPNAERVALTPTVVVTGPLSAAPRQLEVLPGTTPSQVRVTTSQPTTPFRVLGVETSHPAFTAGVTTIAEGRTYDVGVSYRGAAPAKPLTALLKIKTDEPSQPLLLVRLTTPR